MKFVQICSFWQTFLTCFKLNAGDWKLVPGPFTILLKWQYSEIWPFLIVYIAIFNCPFQKNETLESWQTGYWVIGPGCYIEKDLKLSLGLLNCSKDFWKFLPLLISIKWPSLVTWWVVVQKIYSKMHPVSCTNTHHDVTDLVNYGMV